MAHWQFRKLNPNETSGTSTSEDNFAQEERSGADILVRECIQNPLDARRPDADSVQVHFTWTHASKDSSLVRSLITEDFERQLALANATSLEPLPDKLPFLLVEDFGTSGLTGDYADSAIDGVGQNWNAFWFREGEGVKPTKANGGAGQGKLTMYVASQMRTVLALTKRATDGQSLLFGSCRFRRNYTSEGQRYAREARFGSTADPAKLSMPIADEKVLSACAEALGLARKDAPGTSFIVPFPDPAISPDAIALAVVNEFYVPILRGRLVVVIYGREFSKDTIVGITSAMESAGQLRSPPAFRQFLHRVCSDHLAEPDSATLSEAWGLNKKIDVDHLGTGSLVDLRDAFEKGEIVSAKFPVRVNSKAAGAQTGYLRVFLQANIASDQTNEVFIRQDLSVDKEKSLRLSKRAIPAYALILIEDEVLSEFLAAAEEPTHREWNGSRPRLTEKFRAPATPLRLVRNAASRLIELLSPTSAKDSAALAAFFPDFDAAALSKPTAAEKKPSKDEGGSNLVVDPPPPEPRKLDMRPLDDGAIIRVLASNTNASDFPIAARVDLAYATEFGDAFEQWDAADFYLSTKDHVRHIEAVSDMESTGNRLSFTLTSPSSFLVLAGFDKNRQLDMRLRYSEARSEGDQQNN